MDVMQIYLNGLSADHVGDMPNAENATLTASEFHVQYLLPLDADPAPRYEIKIQRIEDTEDFVDGCDSRDSPCCSNGDAEQTKSLFECQGSQNDQTSDIHGAENKQSEDLVSGNPVEITWRSDYCNTVYPEASSSPADPNSSSFPSEPSAVKSLQPKCTDFSLMHMDDRQIRSICHRYEGLGISSCELYDLALDGVVIAYERFDPSKGTKFSSYATHWILERIRDRLKKLPKETAYLSQYTKGLPIGSLCEDVMSEKDRGDTCSIVSYQSHYHEDDTIDEELAELDSNYVEIPSDLGGMFLDHICLCCQDVLNGVTKVASYHRMLSSKVSKKWTEADKLDRQENFAILRAVVEKVLRKEKADTVLKRFGVTCIGFADIAKDRGLTGEAVRCEFMGACKDLILKLKSPLTRPLALDAYDAAMRLARMPVLG